MTPPPENTPLSPSELSPEAARELLQSLRRKEGNWINWGQACQKLQKAGYSSQMIFEETGIEPIQQNLTLVAAQVYDSLLQADADEAVRSYFAGPKSDVLHEFRILNHEQRVSAAQLAMEKQLDVNEAHAVAQAIKNFYRLARLPEGFTKHPGDAVAYQYWTLARGKKDLQERSRAIALGLKFAHSSTAREHIEKLLSDFTVVTTRKAPILPIYRVEAEDNLPRIVPVVGSFPLTRADLDAVEKLEESSPFRVVRVSGRGLWVPIPGWQVVVNADDLVAILTVADRLPESTLARSEPVVVVIDRQVTQWNASSYFLVDRDGELDIQWFEEKPEFSLLGQVILILRPKKVFDENATRDLWQVDE
jgi:Rubisco Assembly chaperone C-terminal domain/Rubisco accumulation factor 1 alpha helical domain/Rubisco accumulation factor 1 helix turn helix domain